MNAQTYRDETLKISAQRVDPLDARQANLALYGLGITGEAGEVADEIKKYLFHGKPLDAMHLIKEVGDVLWYADRVLLWLSNELPMDDPDFTLDDAMAANIAKLRDRFPEGWDAADKHYGYGQGELPDGPTVPVEVLVETKICTCGEYQMTGTTREIRDHRIHRTDAPCEPLGMTP